MILAYNSVTKVIPDVWPLVHIVCNKLKDNDYITVSKIQDEVENILMISGCGEVAKSYILYRHERDIARSVRLKPKTEWISNYIKAAKYAKVVNGKRETWLETITRMINMHKREYSKYVDIDWDWLTEMIHEDRVLPSMRSLQFGGKAIEINHNRMYNCSFTKVNRLPVFHEILYLLLCGCGVGYSVQWEHISKLPPVRRANGGVYHHEIEDSIEGWAEAIGRLIVGTWVGDWVELGYSKIRPEGSTLITSGGIAPGHKALRKAVEDVRYRIQLAGGRQLRPIECHDIICTLAECVMSGGIRRSSLMAMFSDSDTEMMYAKAPGVWDGSGSHAARAMANNSVVLNRNCDKKVFDRVINLASDGYGEPGFFFTNNSDWGTNPCGEIGLQCESAGFGFCNLTEINMAKVKDLGSALEAAQAAAILGTLQAGYMDFRIVIADIAKEERLLGVSMTGMMDNPDMSFNETVTNNMAKEIVKTNHMYAKLIGIPVSARLTCVKPSGTASLLLGCVGSGIHPHHARRYFRRVRVNRYEDCAKRIPSFDSANGIVTFPVEVPDSAITIHNLDAIQFLELVRKTYDNWIVPGHMSGDNTHNISCTVTVKDGEQKDVIDYVWKHRFGIAAMSFAPDTLDKKYENAPREEVSDSNSEREYAKLITKFVDAGEIDYRTVTSATDIGAACDGDKCGFSESNRLWWDQIGVKKIFYFAYCNCGEKTIQ